MSTSGTRLRRRSAKSGTGLGGGTGTRAAASSRDPMDARIRARRARVRAEAARRRQRRTLSLFVLLVVVAGVAVVLRSPLFEISAITVRGVEGDRAEAVRTAASISTGQHLLTAPLEQAQVNVESLAWVSSAVVRRVPPAAVALEVTPRQPLLTVRTAQASWKIDKDVVVVDGGKVPDAPVIDVEDLRVPRLGAAVDDPTVRDAVAVHTALPAWMRSKVARYRITGPRDLWLTVRTHAGDDGDGADKVAVRFGTAADLALKVEVLRVLLPEAAAQRRNLDIRAPANPVIVDAGPTEVGDG